MKKLLIASVSVLALSAGAALAQTANNSTITQGGYSLDSNNNWVGNGDDSVGSVANVTQINGGYGILTSVVQQNDSNQIASVNQTGHGYSTLTSNIVQGGGNGNKAYVTQTDSLGNSTQSSYITQSGTNGYANVNQSGPNDSSTVTQTGNYSDGTW
jgi:trimeric autotransporter adhesin